MHYSDKLFKPYRNYEAESYGTRGFRSRSPKEPRYKANDSNYNDTSQHSSPSFQKSPQRYQENYQEDNLPIWQQLYREGLQSKKLLDQRHISSKNKIDIECTFQPIIKTNKRYLANSSSTFLQRVHIWQENKIQKMLKEKEEEVDKDLKECTFIPKINRSFKKNQQNNSGFKQTRLDKSQNQTQIRNRNINPYYSPINKPNKIADIRTTPKKTPAHNIDMSDAKMMIRNELKRIAL